MSKIAAPPRSTRSGANPPASSSDSDVSVGDVEACDGCVCRAPIEGSAVERDNCSCCRHIAEFEVTPGDGVALAQWAGMAYADVVTRIRADFTEAPAMELTLGQAARLWHIGPDDCRFVLDSLVDAGFLHWTARRTIARRTRPTRVAVSRPPRTFS